LFTAAPGNSIHFVILSAAGTSRSEAPAESKDPYILRAQQEDIREFSRAVGFVEGHGFSRAEKSR
jgi:hypothetical protein